MYRIGISILILPAVIMIAAGCSSTSNTTRSPETAQEGSVTKDSNAAPDWFSGESVTYDNSTIQAYAAAIGSDAASAETKAVARATALLKQSVSSELENIRTEVVKEVGKASGLADAGFLIDLRKADNAVSDIVSTQQSGTAPVEGQNSTRGFAAVQLSKEELIEQLDKRMAAHEDSWNTLKESGTFQKF